MAKPSTSSLSLLPAKAVRNLIASLESWYGDSLTWLNDYFLYSNSKGKVQLSTVHSDDLPTLSINSLGLYLGTFHDEHRFRLSIEGSRLIKAERNYVILKDEYLNNYLTGENLFEEELAEINEDGNAPFLIAYGKGEALGVVTRRQHEFLNYVSKGRKLDYNKLF